jgi:hypothetical protein
MRAPGAGRTGRRRGSLAAALAAATALGWAGAAWSAPITFNTAITLAPGEFVLREQYVLDRSGDDPSGAGRDVEVQGAISVLGYAVDKNLMLFGVLPYLDKRLELDLGGDRRARSARGIADLRLFGVYTVVRRNWAGGLFRLSPFAGIEAPTGDDDESDAFGRLPPGVQLGSGSWDPFGGLVVTYQTLDFEIDAQIAYQANTEANGFEFGDVARADASIQYRVLPRELGPGVPAFVYGVLEANLIHRGRNDVGGVENPNSGGTTLFLVPGLQYASRRWVLEAAVQVPVVQNLNGAALEKDFIVRAGFRFNF